MSSAKTRLSPTESATLYKTNTKKKGNDGNIWIITENKNGVKRWKLHRKPTKIINEISEKQIKLYDRPFESLYYEDVKIINKDLTSEISLSKIQKAMKKLTNEKLLKYYTPHSFDTDDIVKIIQKSKLIFNTYKPDTGGKLYTEIYIAPFNSIKIPSNTISNLKKWVNGQISDGFGENGISIGKYTLFMSFRRQK